MPVDQRAARRRFFREFMAAILAYVGLVFLADFVVDANPDSDWRYGVALLPMVPAAFVVAVSLRYFRCMDELQQRVLLEALAFAFSGTALLTFGYGFLERVGLPHLNWGWVWAVMGGLWLICDWLVRQRRL